MLKDAKQKCDEETKTVSILLLHTPSLYLFVFVVVVFLHKNHHRTEKKKNQMSGMDSVSGVSLTDFSRSGLFHGIHGRQNDSPVCYAPFVFTRALPVFSRLIFSSPLSPSNLFHATR